MFESGVRQLRLALSMTTGRRISPVNLTRLVADARTTLAEFGAPGANVEMVLDGAAADPEQQQHVQLTGLRRTARRLARQSPFYARRFAAAGVRADRLDFDQLPGLPVTTKSELIDSAEEFRCADTTAHLATRTTGTTGRPAEIWLSRYEAELWPALAALSSVLRDELRADDVMQVNMSSRATLSMHMNAAVSRLSGTACRLLGIVPPEQALDSLIGSQTTLLATCPSYLAELVVSARRLGVGAGEFRLRRITLSGEVLSAALARAAAETFGGAQIVDQYAMTEIAPVTARACSQGHLHHELNMGLVETADIRTGSPVEPGGLATLVVTPFFPYRDCTPVLRYDTRDVVRPLAADTLTCEAAAIPATTPILGKANGIITLADGTVVTPRELVDAVESLPTQPWPSRFAAAAVGERLRLTVPEATVAGLTTAEVHEHFAESGWPIELVIVSDSDAMALRHTRSDLHETTFFAAPEVVGDRSGRPA